MHAVEPLLKDTPNKGHNTFSLSIKDKFCGPYIGPWQYNFTSEGEQFCNCQVCMVYA